MNDSTAFENRMRALLRSGYDDFARSLLSPCPPSLRVNTLKGGADKLSPLLPVALTPVAWCDDGFYYPESFAAGKTVLHEAGAYYIQEASAMFPVTALDPRPGETVLDLCAAPGGKSTQAAAAMDGRGVLICNEVVPSRAAILSRNVERMGVRNAVVLNESVRKLETRFPEYFDKILADAPCSGEGMFAKNPAAREEWTPETPEICARRQEAILDSAAAMLKAGGTIVYSTCTFSAEENELRIAAFLRDHPEFEQIAISSPVPRPDLDNTVVPGNIAEKCVRIMPHLAQGNGHFCALLRKKDGGALSQRLFADNVPKAKKKLFDGFARDFLKESGISPDAAFGDVLCDLPDGCPDLTGLKVLRAGLRLGEIVKNRFEPSHSLAAALSGDDASSVLALDADDKRATDYLFGASIESDERGWTLITAGGYSLGWGKGSDGTVKNKYPKGLRPVRR